MIRSDFPTKFGIPRQSGLADVPARIVFEPEYRNADALRGIEGFSHLWLIWQFSAAVRDGWSPTVRPPKLGGNKRIGVFATRSPFRPNEIGLSSVRLDRVELNTPDGTTYTLPGYHISAEVVAEMHKNGSYASVGSLGVLSESSFYTVGTCVKDDNGDADLMIFVSTQDPNSAGVVRHSTQTLVLIMLVTLVVMLVISFMISQHVTRPLKTIAAAAKEFAGGNFDVRVPEDNRCFEIDELAVSFNNMARDLDQLEELTRGFISNVSHEFKTPMTTIGGFVDGMIDGTIPLDQRDKYLKIIAEETKRLSRMVNRMLDAAKIQSGELILSPAPFDFTEMTAQILLSFEQKIEKKKLDVQCDLEERLTVMGDRDHLYRVVYNLTDNAVKFIEDGGTLRLKVHQEGQLCVFAISNTGIGISAEDLPHVFDRFYKTDRSRSMDKTGAGLGLYIVKNIINLHGGEISVRSGGGETEFEFTLPLAPEQNRQNNT